MNLSSHQILYVVPFKKMGQLVDERKKKPRFWQNVSKPTFAIDEDDSQLPDTKKRVRISIPLIHITADEVEKLLLNIKVNKAYGPF